MFPLLTAGLLMGGGPPAVTTPPPPAPVHLLDLAGDLALFDTSMLSLGDDLLLMD